MRTLYIHGSADHYGSAKILLDILHIPGNASEAMVVLPHDGLLVQDLKKLNIPVRIINLGILRRKYFTPLGILGRIFLWIAAILKLRAMIRKEKIERIYINSANVIIGPFLKSRGIQLVWHIHEIVEQPAVLRNILCRLFLQADQLITVSKAAQSFWSAHARSDRFQLLYNGMDTSRFKEAKPNRKKYCPAATENDLIIGMIGRIQPWKGQSYFLEIMHQYYEHHAPAIDQKALVCIAGDPYPGNEHLTEELMINIKGKGMEKQVTYNGYVYNTPEWMASIDILVLPSVQPDPLPTVVLEAMSAGKPVLATAQGGALEMVEADKTGLFLPLGDAAAAAAVLARLIRDKKMRGELGENAQERVERLFSAERFAIDWHRLLNS